MGYLAASRADPHDDYGAQYSTEHSTVRSTVQYVHNNSVGTFSNAKARADIEAGCVGECLSNLLRVMLRSLAFILSSTMEDTSVVGGIHGRRSGVPGHAESSSPRYFTCS
jgi:hypothetical protein